MDHYMVSYFLLHYFALLNTTIVLSFSIYKVDVVILYSYWLLESQQLPPLPLATISHSSTGTATGLNVYALHLHHDEVAVYLL